MLTDSWKRIYYKSYQVQKGATTRSEAVTACEEVNGKLFEPKTAFEKVDVMELLRNVGIMYIHNIVWNYEAEGNPWKPIGDKVYEMIMEPKSFDDAAKHCIQIGGKLFEPKSEKENDDVIDSFETLQFWLGIHDNEEEGHFKYQSDNSELEFEKWYSGEPNNINNEENCARVVHGSEHQWNDIPCHLLSPFVCEKKGK